MKAVIMAGGEGKRLRAVSGENPKPLTPLLGKPIMERIICLLRDQGFDDICATVRYKADMIEDRFGDGSELNVKLRYSKEQEPLGTAGGVKNCESFYGRDDFLIISGDAACDFDLKRLMEIHRETAAAVTVALYKSPSPLSYGLAVTDSDGRVRSFIEKPDWQRVVTDLVNTGIYVMNPKAMSYVPRGVQYDFAKDLFPLLLHSGDRIQGAVLDGYWCDIGSPLAYYQCCADALEGRLKIDIPELFKPKEELRGPVEQDEGGELIFCPCGDRAAVMGTLSELMMDMGADYSNGIQLHGKNYTLSLNPLSERSAVAVRVNSEDAEFAHSLALSAAEVIKALDM